MLKYAAKYGKYGIWRAYLSTPFIVKWGIPKKVIENVAQMRQP